MTLRLGPAASVRARLTLWNVTILALALIAVGGMVRYRVRANLTAAVDRSLRARAEQVQSLWPLRARATGWIPYLQQLRDAAGQLLFPALSGNPGRLGRAPRLLTLDGRSMLTGQPLAPWDARGFARAVRGDDSFRTVLEQGVELRVYSRPLSSDGRVDAVLQWAESLAPASAEVARLTRALLMLIPLALLVAGVGGAFLTSRALLPVRQITEAAAHIEAQTLSGRLPVRGKDEFAALAATFNGMLERLERAFEQQSRFTADASHELRTPLAIARAKSSLALSAPRSAEEYRRAMEVVDQALERMTGIVQDLLFLARADREASRFCPEPIALAALMAAARDAVEAGGTGPAVRVELPDPPLFVLGEREPLTRLLQNLVENAIRHTPASGKITLTACCESDDRVTLIVADTGDGIPPEHLPHLFERFYRVDEGRTRTQGGVGLGLAICKSIAEAHGGTIRIESALGNGTTVTVTLPRAAASPAPPHPV